MKTTTKNKEKFDAVLFMRQQRNRLSEMLSKMTKAEIVEYFRIKAAKTTIKPRY
jgi:hypothetical protein